MQRQRIPILVTPLAMIVTAVLAAAGGGLFMSVSTAHAEIDGPCEALIAGVSIRPLDSGNRDDDIHVSENQQVVVTAASPLGFESHRVELEFAGQRWTVSDEEDDGSTSWSDTVNVNDYATWGVGLYKVIGVSTFTDGSTCEGAATVDVDGNPLTTVAGGVALGGGLVAIGGAVATTTRSATRGGGFGDMVDMVEDAFQEEQRAQAGGAQTGEQRRTEAEETVREFGGILPWLFGWCVLAIPFVLLLPILALAGGGESKGDGGDAGGGATPSPSEPAPKPAANRPSLPKPPWTPRMTLVGVISGFIGGVASVVLMQQYSIEYPTLAVVLRTVIVTTLIGGLVLPTLGHTFAWFRARSKIAAWERELGWRD